MKTDETLKIEKLLRHYSPNSLAGQKLNKFRGRSLAFECVVECGDVKGGIIDCFRVDETLTNARRHRTCKPGMHKNAERYQSLIPPCGTPLADLPERCGNRACPYNSYMIEYDNEVMTTCFEIKVTKADFHSKNGHNFCGNANFYVMPHALYKQVAEEIPDDIGVIICTNSGLRRVKDSAYRTLSSDVMMLQILNVLKKNRLQ